PRPLGEAHGGTAQQREPHDQAQDERALPIGIQHHLHLLFGPWAACHACGCRLRWHLSLEAGVGRCALLTGRAERPAGGGGGPDAGTLPSSPPSQGSTLPFLDRRRPTCTSYARLAVPHL